jgi:hypothetical protein
MPLIYKTCGRGYKNPNSFAVHCFTFQKDDLGHQTVESGLDVDPYANECSPLIPEIDLDDDVKNNPYEIYKI